MRGATTSHYFSTTSDDGIDEWMNVFLCHLMQKMNTIALAAMHVVTFLRLDRTSFQGWLPQNPTLGGTPFFRQTRPLFFFWKKPPNFNNAVEW